MIQNTMFLFAFIVVFSSIQTGLLASYCNDITYTTISDARRSTAFKTILSHMSPPVPCDRAIIQDDFWYRFSSDAGGELSTTKPELSRCGTNVPMWMNGTHPTVEEGTVKRKVCANFRYRPPIGCGVSYTINVRNCSGFYIYQLKRPRECFLGYCAGSKLPNCTAASPKDYCLENSPPKINMPDRLYTFGNRPFTLIFDATDREGYPLKYDFDRTETSTSDVSIDQANKTVTISATKSGSVVLIVKEHLLNGLQSNHTIMIDVQPCPCRNGGKCHSNVSVSTEPEKLSYTCECAVPYAGTACEKGPCDSSPCFAGLECFVTNDSYMCENCPANFTGDGKKCQRVQTKETVVVKAELTIDAGLDWNDNLLNKSSVLYKQRTAEIIAQINQAYKNMKDFLYVVVIAYRKGSVVVEFELVMKKKVDDPLKSLKKYIKDNNGTLGKFRVQPNKVKDKTTPQKNTYFIFGIRKTIFIVVVCIVSLLFLTLIVMCGICIKKKKVSIIMLTLNDDDIILENRNELPRRGKRSPSRNQVMDLQTFQTRSY